MEDKEIARGVNVVGDTVQRLPRVVYAVILRNFGGGVARRGPRPDFNDSVHNIHHRPVEGVFLQANSVAMLAVFLVVLVEGRVHFDRVDSRSP